jgi:phosphopantothenoylcysteine decarboxylase/phosphopantothenate--cysteine ligase
VCLCGEQLARILITSGPTRQYLDPVRYLTNASSGRMGRALAEAALALGHDVVVVSGPVEVVYPTAARVMPVVSTEEMLAAAAAEFETCDGLIGAAAPCDYRPVRVESHKIAKTGQPIDLHLVETDDVVATLGQRKGRRWVVGFALETEDHRLRALAKLEQKCCDLMVSNGPTAISALDNEVEVLTPSGEVIASLEGSKEKVAAGILAIVQQRLIQRVSVN